jgi:hypothetical protein
MAMTMAMAIPTDYIGVVVGMADVRLQSIIHGKTTSSGIHRISTVSKKASTVGHFVVAVSMAEVFMAGAAGMGAEPPTSYELRVGFS